MAALPSLHGTNLVAAAACLLVTALLYRNLSSITRLAWLLFGGVLVTLAGVIVSGIVTGNAIAGAGSWHLQNLIGWPSHSPASGDGPGHSLYLLRLLGLLQHLLSGRGGAQAGEDDSPRHSDLDRGGGRFLYRHESGSPSGHRPGVDAGRGRGCSVAAGLGGGYCAVRLWPLRRADPGHADSLERVFVCLFAAAWLLARPYAAALDGNYFSGLAAVHPKHGIPHRSLVALGLAATFFCFFSLKEVITLLVVIRILLQFLLQQGGVIWLRYSQPDLARPFRMPLFPLPPLLAITGFVFVLAYRPNPLLELGAAAAIAASGTAIYMARARSRREWPFLK
jgi:hypothetical protein